MKLGYQVELFELVRSEGSLNQIRHRTNSRFMSPTLRRCSCTMLANKLASRTRSEDNAAAAAAAAIYRSMKACGARDDVQGRPWLLHTASVTFNLPAHFYSCAHFYFAGRAQVEEEAPEIEATAIASAAGRARASFSLSSINLCSRATLSGNTISRVLSLRQLASAFSISYAIRYHLSACQGY